MDYMAIAEEMKKARAVSIDDIGNAMQLIERRKQIATAELEIGCTNEDGLQTMEVFKTHIKQLLAL